MLSNEGFDLLGGTGCFPGWHGKAQGFELASHGQLVLRMNQSLGIGANFDSLGFQRFEQMPGDMLVVEGQRIKSNAKLPQRFKIVVVAGSVCEVMG